MEIIIIKRRKNRPETAAFGIQKKNKKKSKLLATHLIYAPKNLRVAYLSLSSLCLCLPFCLCLCICLSAGLPACLTVCLSLCVSLSLFLSVSLSLSSLQHNDESNLREATLLNLSETQDALPSLPQNSIRFYGISRTLILSAGSITTSPC